MAAEGGSALRRLFRLWRIYARMEAVWLFRGGPQAIAYIVADLITMLAGVSGTLLLAVRFDGIGGWSFHQVVFMLGFALLARGSIDMLFGWNVSHISRRLGRGQLDHTLVQPHPLWLTLFTEGFSPLTGSSAVLAGSGIVVWAATQIGVQATPLWLGAFALNLAASIAVMMAFAYAWGAAAFWSPHAAEEINSRTWSIMDSLHVFPLDGVGAFLQFQLLTWIPAGLVAWMPARALLNTPGDPGLDVLFAPLGALVAVLLAAVIFHRGLRHYGRVGSSRYLDWGHRR